MEEDNRSRINKFLFELVEHTVCKAPFLEFFVEKGLFATSDIATIKAKQDETEQASEFYRLIQTRKNSYQILLEGLTRTGQSDIVTILEKGLIPPKLNVKSRVRKLLYDNENAKRVPLDNSDPIPHSNTKFDVSEPVSIFAGRRKEMKNLHQMVLRSGASGKPAVISQVTSISGLGGIGKTQLARQYVKDYASDFDGNCIWLEGEAEASLSAGFRTLAKDKLGVKTDDVNGKDKDIKSVVSDVYAYFSESKCLFVFDNVEKCTWLKKYLPKSSNSCPNIIFTSRNREWEKGIEVIDLFELDEEDAFQMVKKGLGLEKDCSQDETIFELVRRFQCFPLALHQAISYILDQQETGEYSVATYLQNFWRKKTELLSFDINEGENFELLNDYAMTTFTTWKITIARIREAKEDGELALQILYSMAFLYPEKIDRELFLRHPNIKQDVDDDDDDAIAKLKSAVRLLVKFSMVRGDDKQRLLSIHRLVQEVMQAELIRKDMGSQVLGNVLQMLIWDKMLLYEKRSQIGVHLQVVISNMWKYPNLIPELSSTAGVNNLIDSYYKKFPQFGFGSDSFERVSTMFGGKSEQFFEFLQTMLLATLRFSRKKEFLEIQEKLLSGLVEFIDKDDEQALIGFTKWGLVYYEIGIFEVSLKFFEKICSTKDDYLKRPIFGTNLAMALLNLGRAQEASDILTNIYENLESAAQNYRSTLKLVSRSLGLCMNEVKDYDGVLKILEKIYEGDDVLSEEETINTCHLIRVVGTVLRNQGNSDGAIESHLNAYQKYVEIYGHEHFYPEICRTEIAEDLISVGSHEQAVKILEVALPKLETLVPNHYVLLRKQVLFAEALGKQGKDLETARAILEDVMQTIIERGWTKVAYFEKVVKEIIRIQNALGDNTKE